jgi:hypothetical protein
MTQVFVHLVFVHVGISLDGFVAAVNCGPRNPFGHLGMKVHERMFPAGVRAAATGSGASNDCTGSGALHARERFWRFRVTNVFVRRTYEERV